MPRLTPRVLDFIAVYCADPHRNGADAYRRSTGSKAEPATCTNEAYKLLQRPDVRAIVARYDERLAENLILSASDVARIWTENITTDRNEVVQVRRICCRCCHSPNGEPMFTPAEQIARRKEHDMKVRLALARMPDSTPATMRSSVEAAMEFDEMGGVGYDQRKPINPDCPECFGEGQERVFIPDTRKLPPAARAIYEGAKVTKDGIEVKMASRADALGMLAKAYGMGADKPPPRPGDGARDITPTDPQEASKHYRRIMDESED